MAATAKQLQRPVEELADIIPLDDMRMGDDITVLENDAGTLYAVEEKKVDTSGRNGVELDSDAEIARVEAGDQLEVTKVDPEDLDESELQGVDGNTRVGD